MGNLDAAERELVAAEKALAELAGDVFFRVDSLRHDPHVMAKARRRVEVARQAVKQAKQPAA